jgi:aquaporin NIP
LNPALWRRSLAEVAGTALLVGIGTGTIVGTSATPGFPPWALAFAWFVAVAVPIVLFVSISGAHLNPAVSLALASSGRISWREVPAYWAGQLVGAFLGSGTVLLVLGSGAHLGATVPADGNVVRALLGEAGFTALLVGAVFYLADAGEGLLRWRLLLPPAAVGVSTYVIGPWTGSSLNPARTIAPAVLSGTYTDLWVYLVAVPLAAVAVALAWKPRSVDIEDRGPGRLRASGGSAE